MKLQITTLRSRVGTYHKGYTQGGAFCNSRMGVSIASAHDIARAADHMFCEKCFPSGRPA
jgi:hypothetical protein